MLLDILRRAKRRSSVSSLKPKLKIQLGVNHHSAPQQERIKPINPRPEVRFPSKSGAKKRDAARNSVRSRVVRYGR